MQKVFETVVGKLKPNKPTALTSSEEDVSITEQTRKEQLSSQAKRRTKSN